MNNVVNEVGVIGLGKFGYSLASSLTELGKTVVGIDKSEQNVRMAQNTVSHVYQADAVDKKALEQLHFQDLDCVVVSVGKSMEASILTILNLQDLGIKQIWVKAISMSHKKVLERLGVDMVVFPEMYVAKQLAHKLSVSGFLDYLSLGRGVVLKEVSVEHWAGKSLRDLDLTNRYKVQVVAIKTSGEENFSFVPKADTILNKNDTLLILGSSQDVIKLAH